MIAFFNGGCVARRQGVAQMHGRQQPLLDRAVVVADGRLERRDHVADDVFRRVMQQRGESIGGARGGFGGGEQSLDQQRVLSDRKDLVAARLPVPARDARQAMRNILDLDIERRGLD